MSDLDAILRRSRIAYGKVADLAGDAEYLAGSVREHFEHDVPALAAEVRRLTAELDAIGGMQVIEHEGHRLRVITSALHDRLCTWRIATPQGTTPEVLGCAGCGFCYPPVVAHTEQEGTDSRG